MNAINEIIMSPIIFNTHTSIPENNSMKILSIADEAIGFNKTIKKILI